MKITEKMIENQIIEWLNFQQQTYAFKLDVKGTWDPSKKIFRKAGKNVPIGGSDIICCHKGRFLSFEVKTPDAYKKFLKSTNPHIQNQKIFMEKIDKSGGDSFMVCSLNQVINIFETLL